MQSEFYIIERMWVGHIVNMSQEKGIPRIAMLSFIRIIEIIINSLNVFIHLADAPSGYPTKFNVALSQLLSGS